jgi:hypothetical protein
MVELAKQFWDETSEMDEIPQQVMDNDNEEQNIV